MGLDHRENYRYLGIVKDSAAPERLAAFLGS